MAVEVALAMLRREGRWLLQLRDNIEGIAAPGTWGLFGGHLDPGEAPEAALRRELLEEISWSAGALRFWFRHSNPQRLAHFFLGELSSPLESLDLHEGQDMALARVEEMRSGWIRSARTGERHPLAPSLQVAVAEMEACGWSPPPSDLSQRYERLRRRLQRHTDFSPTDLEASRALFEQRDGQLQPRAFDVWTLLAGLPAPAPLTHSLAALADEIASLLPPQVRFYRVEPATYHWETFILQRPDECLADHQRREVVAWGEDIFAAAPPLSLSFRGWLLTPDGTLIACGHGPIDGLRQELRRAFPWASGRQSELGHISLGRLLDPVGPAVYGRLLERMEAERDRDLGQFRIDQVRYVHETRWYMREWRELAVFPLNST
jgi:8-oxo-dGTP pyrophosphatase MutT (NUDIX family)